MNIKLNIPWARYGLIVRLAETFGCESPQFGKTALQKAVYLLQEVYEVDCGYDFELYAYGPFATQLLQDLDSAEALGGVDVHPVVSGPGGYSITPGSRSSVFLERAKGFLDRPKTSEAIDQLTADFGDCAAKDLELYSTIIFVWNSLRRRGSNPREEELAGLVHEIKPKFFENEVFEAIDDLVEMDHVSL